MKHIHFDYKLYMDKYGLVHPWTHQTSENGLFYTGQYIAALDRHDCLTYEDKKSLEATYRSCERYPGLLMRDPNHFTLQQGPDDHYATLYADYMLKYGFAKRFLDYGRMYTPKGLAPDSGFWTKAVYSILSCFGLRKVKYVYNNVDPETFSLKAFMGRFPALIATAKFVAGEKLSFFDKLAITIQLIGSAFALKKEHDLRTLMFFVVKMLKGQSFMIDKAIKIWIINLKTVFPGGMGELLEDYFQDSEHPSVIYLENEYGE